MNKVTTKSWPQEVEATGSDKGVVAMRAQIIIAYPDGLYRTKRILVDRHYNISQEQAKRETDAMRELNQGLEIRSVYSVDL